MHDTAYKIGGLVVQAYLPTRRSRILEIGSQDVNGSLRDHAPRTAEYVGLDFEAGAGVDRVVTGRDDWGVDDGYFDLVMASSVFEHDQAFWRTFETMCRKTSDGGHIYISAPSNGKIHRYPKDYWRFYPDAGLALEEWARGEGLEVTLVESFTAAREQDVWNDFCAVFRCGSTDEDLNVDFVHQRIPCENVITWRSSHVGEATEFPEDMRLIVGGAEEVDKWRGHADHLIHTAGQNEQQWLAEREQLVERITEGERQAAALEAARGELKSRDEAIARLKSESKAHEQGLAQLTESVRFKDAHIERLSTAADTGGARIAELESALSTSHYEVTEQRSAVEAQAAALDKVGGELRSRDEVIERLMGENDAHGRALDQMTEGVRAKDAHIDNLTTANRNGDERIASLEGALATSEEEVVRLRAEDERLQEDLRTAGKQAQRADEQRKEQDALFTELSQKSNEVKSRLAQRDEEVSQAWAEVKRVSEERDELQRTLAAAGEELVEANGWVTRLALHRTTTEREIDRLEREVARKVAQEEGRALQSDKLGMEVETLRADLARAAGELRRTQDTLRSARTDLATAAAENAGRLESGRDQLRKEKASLAVALSDLQESRKAHKTLHGDRARAADDLKASLDEQARIAAELSAKGDALDQAYQELATISRMLVEGQDECQRLEQQNQWLRTVGTLLVEQQNQASLLRPYSWSRKKRDELLRANGLFDATLYASRYPDVEASGQEPLRHAIKHGIAENRQLD